MRLSTGITCRWSVSATTFCFLERHLPTLLSFTITCGARSKFIKLLELALRRGSPSLEISSPFERLQRENLKCGAAVETKARLSEVSRQALNVAHTFPDPLECQQMRHNLEHRKCASDHERTRVLLGSIMSDLLIVGQSTERSVCGSRQTDSFQMRNHVTEHLPHII